MGEPESTAKEHLRRARTRDVSESEGRVGVLETLLRRRREGRALLLDGATGTELEARGIRSALPLWSTHALLEAPAIVQEVHRSYCESGAELITANTFRTQRRTLARAGIGERDRELTRLALSLARSAVDEYAAAGGERTPWVFGSAPPLEDCYRPDLVPDDPELSREHARHAENLALAGADGILVETIGTLREARAALQAARGTGLPAFVSFAASVSEDGVPRLLSGESLAAAVEFASAGGAHALLVNCVPSGIAELCTATLASSALPFGCYPNQGAPLPVGGSDDALPAFDHLEDPDAFAARAQRWVRAGATIVGGCCGTTPAHLRALALALP